MNVPLARDNTNTGYGEYRITDNLRPLPGASYPAGTVLWLVPLDSQQGPDMATVAPVPAGDLVAPLMGAITAEWISAGNGGFDGRGNPLAPAIGARGTRMVDLVDWGQHNAVFVDQSGAAAVALIHGSPLSSSQNTPGYAQGAAGRAGLSRGNMLGSVVLPAAGFGSAISAGALVQPTQTVTVTNAVTGATYTITLQVSGSGAYPGVPQTHIVSYTAPAGSTVTTIAAALVAAILADSALNKIYLPSNVAGVITIAALGTGRISTFLAAALAQTSNIPNSAGGFGITASGSGANGLTVTAVASGGGTMTQGGPSLAGGVGYFGSLPAFLSCV